jgi:hypothetical protein
MSSHHFVREGQEPAVVVLGSVLNDDVLGSILEWSPLVYANAVGLLYLSERGIKVDVCWWDKPDDLPLHVPYPIELVLLPERADIPLKALLKKAQPFYVFGWDDLQIFSFFRNLSADEAQLVTAISTDTKWVSVFLREFSKWYPEGKRLSYFGNPDTCLLSGPVLLKETEIILEEAGVVNCCSDEPGLLGEPL